MGTVHERSARQAPTARRLLLGIFVYGGVFALAVVCAVGALLMKVRSDTESEVRTMLSDSAAAQLAASAAQQAELLSQELGSATMAIEFVARAAATALAAPSEASAAEVARYSEGPDGSYITSAVDHSKVSMFYSGYHPVGVAQREKAAQLSAIDPALVAVVETNSLIAQAYINTWDSLNRIYPGVDVLGQFVPKLDITKFSFYYLADEQHDPERKVAWTNGYVDPAGQGWMISAIAPVYVNNHLEAVVGIDVTISQLVGQLLSNRQAFGAYSILVDAQGSIMAMPAAAEQTFGLKELTNVDYATYAKADTFKPEQFDITKRADTVALNHQIGSAAVGQGATTVAGVSALVAWQTVSPMNWRVISIVPTASVHSLEQPIDRLSDAAATVFWIVGLAFALMIVGLTWRARRLSLSFTRPLREIDLATTRMAAGDFVSSLPPAPVAELDRTGRQLLKMGSSLREAQERMLADSQRLRDGEQRYRAIFENVTEPVMTVDAHGAIVDANDAARDAFGEVLPGQQVQRLLGEDSWRTAGRRMVQIGNDLESRTFELAVGSSGEGDDALYTLTAHDATSTVLARTLLEDAAATALHTARLKDEFLASMSHEIRTPLNGVLGVLSLLAARPLPEEARQELAIARRSADDLLVLVNDVLDFAKIEAGQVSIVNSHVQLDDLLESIRQLYSPFAEELHNELNVTVDPNVPEWVQVDQTRLRQVLMNLVSNALKFTEGGHVTVAVQREAAPTQDQFKLRFTVTDTGVGISPDLRARLFTRFTQGDPLTARHFPGTGLGLAIVKRLVELMGGEVGVDSELGAGSRFWFTIESAAGIPSTSINGLPPAAGTGAVGHLRVLVAEDNDVNRFFMLTALERLGHSTQVAVNGREAVDAVRREHFDVVLMDVQMPVMSGLDATRAIRALPGAAGMVPIVAVTANVLPAQQELYRQTGFTEWLPKPLTLDQVEDTLRRMFGNVDAAPGAALEAAVADDLVLFDHDLVAKHRKLFGAAGVDKLLVTFVSSLAERRNELETCSAADDLEGVRRAGHTIKGMAGAIGARRLWAAGERLQHADDEDLPAMVAALNRAAEEALAGLERAWRG